MSTITVIAAVANEAVNLPQWLEHLAWVDQVFIVLTDSRDGSREIIEQSANVEIIEGEAGLIHTAKNKALDKVKSGWVLDLDLDERLSDPLIAEIQALISQADPTHAAYRLPFLHYAFGRYLKHGGWLTQHLRLSQAGKLRYPQDRAHSSPEVDGTIGLLENSVIHFAQPRLHDFLAKMNLYTSQDAPLILKHEKGGLRNKKYCGTSRLKFLRRSLGIFWNRYIKAAGFRDGVAGLIMATMLSLYVFVEQAKVWELLQEGEAETPPDSPIVQVGSTRSLPGN